MDESKLNIKKAIEEGSHVTSLSNLADRGIRNVKVLDEQALQELIRKAVDQAISTQTEEERAKIVADSRQQLDRLMKERNEFMSQANLLESGKNDLVQQVEKLQEELKLRRQIEEQGEATFQAQLKEITDRHRGSQDRIQELLGENTWLREEHDRLVEELDKAQTEIKRLNQEIENLRAGVESDQAALRRELDFAYAEITELKRQLSEEQGRVQEALEKVKADSSRITQERDDALREIDALKGRLESEREKARQAEEKAAGPAAEIQQDFEVAREEVARLKTRLAEQTDVVRGSEEALKTQHAEFDRRLKEALEEADRLKQEHAKEAEAWAARSTGAQGRAEVPQAEVHGGLQEVKVLEETGRPAEAPVQGVAAAAGPSDLKKGKGLDIGTVNLVAAEQDEKGEVAIRLKRNVFIDVEITAYTKSMLTRLKVPYFVQGKKMYVLGEDAFELANILNRNTRRPMRDGLISPKEQDALPVMKLLIGSILGQPRVPDEICFYSVPGDPVDSDLSVAYHRDLFDAVLRALGYAPKHIIEGHAVTFAELADEDFTGIGVSCGGGMFNICVAYKSMPALTFSSARSGDWVDLNVAQALGIKPAKATLLKEKGVDLMNPKTREEDAIAIYYRNLIKYNLTNIAERFRASENMPSFKEPISIVFSGGTALAGNFIELVKVVFKELDFPIPVKDLRMAKDPFNATAKGALTAAILEMSQQTT